MPVVPFIPAIVSAGTAIYSASQQRSAANSAQRSADAAAERQLAEQRAARERVEQLQTPYMGAGNAALQQLAQEFGLGVAPGGLPPGRVAYPTGAGAGSGTAAMAGGGNAGTSPLDNARPNPYATDSFGPTRIPQPGDADYGMYQEYLRSGGGAAGSPLGGGGQPAASSPGGNPTLSTSGRPQQAPQQMVDGAGYLQANPDVAALWNSLPPEEQARRGGVNQFAATHYSEASGRGEARTLPATTYQPASGAAEQTFTRPDAAPAPTYTRPDAAPPPQFTRPDAPAAEQYTRPTMARPDQPTFNDPGDFGSFNFDASRIAEDPGYQFRLNESLRAANTGFAARGLLKSGGAIKGVMDRASGLASQEVANAFARQMSAYQANAGTHQANRTTGYNIFSGERNNLNDNFESDRGNLNATFESDRGFGEDRRRYDTNRLDTNFTADRAFGSDQWRYITNRQDENFDRDRGFNTELWRYDTERRNRDFESDRGYATSRADVRTGNLFDLAQMGTGAAASVGGAAQTYANNAGSIFGSQAQSAADAAAQRAAANAGAAGAVGGAAANIFNTYVPRSSAPASSVGTVNYGNSTQNVFNRQAVY